MTKCTVRDRSYPKMNVETWHYFFRGHRRVGLAVQPRNCNDGSPQGATLPVSEARRLIKVMSRICDEIDKIEEKKC